MRVVAGADIANEPRERFVDNFDAPASESVEEALAEHADEADTAAITTPHALHTEHVLACFEYDLHVLLEKPLTVGLEDATHLADEAEDRDLVLQAGYQRHFHPGYPEVKRLIEAGRIDELHSINAYLAEDWLDATEGWRDDAEMSGGGQLYDSGSHLLDVQETSGEPYSTEVEVTGEGDNFAVLMREKLAAFQNAIASETPSPVPSEQGLQVLALTEAAYEARRTGECVNAQRLIDEARE